MELNVKWDKMLDRFTKDTECQTNSISFFDKIIDFLDKGNAVDLIYLDFSKAFDMVLHEKLLVLLVIMEFSKGTLRQTRQQLKGKQQWLCLKGEASSRKKVFNEGALWSLIWVKFSYSVYKMCATLVPVHTNLETTANGTRIGIL